MIGESGALGFSIQEVADRAGVTHRTVYNHFPSREELNDALAVHVEEELGKVWPGTRPPDEGVGVTGLASMATLGFPLFERLATHVRAYVMLMLATRGPAKVSRDRTERIVRVIDGELGPLPPGVARAVAAAIRMFASSNGWHLLTEHLGLSTSDATSTSAWVIETLLTAVRQGNLPPLDERHESIDGD